MTEHPPERDTGTLFAITLVEQVLRRDRSALDATLGAASDHELRFAVAWLAGNVAAYVRKVHGDDDVEELIARWRQEALGGGAGSSAG